jgi:hypothetical protein
MAGAKTTIEKAGRAVASLLGAAPRRFADFPEWREARDKLARARNDGRENRQKIEDLRRRFEESVRAQAERDDRVRRYLDGDEKAAEEALPPIGNQALLVALDEYQAREQFFAEAIRLARERLATVENAATGAIWQTVKPEYRERVARIVALWADLAGACDELRAFTDSLRPEITIDQPAPLRLLGGAGTLHGNCRLWELLNDREIRDLGIPAPEALTRARAEESRERSAHRAALAAARDH